MGGGGARKAWHIWGEVNIFSHSILYIYYFYFFLSPFILLKRLFKYVGGTYFKTNV